MTIVVIVLVKPITIAIAVKIGRIGLSIELIGSAKVLIVIRLTIIVVISVGVVSDAVLIVIGALGWVIREHILLVGAAITISIGESRSC